MSRNQLFQFASVAISSALLFTPAVQGVDFHAFEFNDFSFTPLSLTTNTGIPGGQSWVEAMNLNGSETDGSGNFVIRKLGDDFQSNYLQIDNISSSTSGSRYIVVRMSGWDFYDSVVGEGEEIRFDFLDDDTGDSGSSVTSQVRIDRNTDTGDIELRGTAIGVGSSEISSRATLNTTQNLPFTMVLELNKTSNTYEVFYKDGSNPSQTLGAAPISPSRNGNSIRFSVNNNFFSDVNEYFSIDRIALSDTNPLNDLMTLEVDRITGAMTLKNTTGLALSGLRSYSITSEAGALNAANWKSVTDNYDQAPQNGSVDIDGAWSKTSTTAFDLSEGVIGGNGGNLNNNQMVVLSQGSGPWIKSPIEDLEITLNFDGGITRKANVNFVGNGGKRFQVGDLNFDGMLSVADWTTFNAGAETNLVGLSEVQAYQAGDLNNDGFNNIIDFSIFKDAYVAIHGLPAFEAAIAGVPEPSTALLLTVSTLLLASRRRRATQDSGDSNSEILTPNEEPTMKYTFRPISLCLAMATLLIASSATNAAILEEFLFDDSNGTLLDGAANNVNTGNMWLENTSAMTGSSVQNGKYHIQKSNNDFGTNYLDIANVTSGKSWLVAEISGWNFSSLIGPGEFDSSELEQVRFAFINNDDLTGSEIVGQANIQRNGNGDIELVGALTTGAPEMGPLPLTLSRNTPFTVVVEIDEDAEEYSVYYKDDTNPFMQLGTAAPHAAGRDGNNIRLTVNNNFGGTGEFFDIDRIYLTDTNPTNLNPDKLTLQVDATSGLMQITNDTSSTIEMDAYTITSSTLSGDLNFAGWNSLNDRNPLLDPVDGPDGGTTLGDGPGETWDEAPGSTDKVLAERFLLGKSVFTGNADRTEMLGNAFKVGGDINSLTFQYRNADTGTVVTGNIVPASLGISGDFDNDGDVDGRDFLVWQRGGTTPPLSPALLAAWQAQYNGGALQAAAQAVPEPAAMLLVGMGLVGLGCFRTRQ